MREGRDEPVVHVADTPQTRHARIVGMSVTALTVCAVLAVTIHLLMK